LDEQLAVVTPTPKNANIANARVVAADTGSA
jgi:hypothetical protein